jgi:hypothetical protein
MSLKREWFFNASKPKNIFSVFRTGIETNRISSKQTEKITKKPSLLGGPQNRQFFLSVRTETNLNSICFGCFQFAFSRNPQIFL